MILAKAVLVQMYSKDTTKRQSDESIFINLASVDFFWWKTMVPTETKSHFKIRIRHLSKVYIQRAKMRSTIIRNNRNFLKEVIDPDKIIFPLESCGCLTEDQVTFLTRLRNRKDKNHELLFMLQDFSSQKYSKMIDCLFLANQTPAALVLERGGEAVKVSINNGIARRTRDFEMKFIERFLQQIRPENTLKLDLLDDSAEIILDDVSILHAKQNKGIEFWFWCETKTFLNQLKGLSDDDLREIIQRMYQRLIPKYSTYLEPQFIQMDHSLANDVAERRLSIRHVGVIDNWIETDIPAIEVYRFSNYVTSLEGKIYIAQEGKILVYENKYPYHATDPIVYHFEREGRSLPFSIISCNTNKCLYVFFYDSPIFKVEPEFENRVSEWLNKTGTETNMSISVTSKGDVLVLQHDIGSFMLLIFTPVGAVKRTISMDNSFHLDIFIQEIMPDIVAVTYNRYYIAIMRLDDNGTILRRIGSPLYIFGLSSFRYGDLLLGVFRYRPDAIKRSRDLVSLNFDDSPMGNDESVIVHHGALESKVTRDLLAINQEIYGIHFAADQKQLYVITEENLAICQLNYEDEDCCP